MIVLAHGVGEVRGLPLPGELVLQTGGVVVLASFLAVALLWREPRFAAVAPGRPPPPASAPALAPVSRESATSSARVGTFDSASARFGQAAMLLLATAVVVFGFLGPQEDEANPAPRVLYVLLWVGVVPASLLLGPVWRAVNPLRALHRLLAPLRRRPPAPLPDRGYGPAAVGLGAFVWLELVAPARDVPAVVATFLLLYAVIHTAAALRHGPTWFDRGDTFEAYSSLVGALAPVEWHGGPRLRNPLRGLAAVPPARGLVAFVAVWWGSTVFDGLSGWPGWATVRAALPVPGVVVGTLVLVALVGVVALLYRLATGRLAAALAPTLVPIAAGYTIAHYLTLLLVEGPRGLAQLVAPLHGLGEPTAVPDVVLVAAVQIAAVLVGHVVAVVVAHDRCVALLPPHRRLADQIPLVLLMVAYTMVGLFLLVIS
ncbi:hypothetical protein [Pseudonocardia charpentierae]|uniref:Uncharacterized protein n=1 Tax=Pseudonocardia charpentierae TaxID=3075545 RepID=A0ABU2NFX2_9PSEU|nr:hypothetical protein [Pseudonocardia sp. DSM 45834]MDT0352497.1 hypothetical protein [Pseudonocardia sp. DSM 45834]